MLLYFNILVQIIIIIINIKMFFNVSYSNTSTIKIIFKNVSSEKSILKLIQIENIFFLSLIGFIKLFFKKIMRNGGKIGGLPVCVSIIRCFKFCDCIAV